MDKFLKLPNFQKSHAAFQKWMQNKYNVDVNTIGEDDCKILLFNTMKETKDDINNGRTKVELHNTSADVDILNNLVLNKLQKYYVDKYVLVATTDKLHVETLNRDSDLYGNRPVKANEMLPRVANEQSNNSDVNAYFSRLVSERDHKSKESDIPNQTLPSINQKEEAIPVHEFDRLFKKAQENTNTILEESIQLQKPIIPEDPQAIFTKPLDMANSINSDITTPNQNSIATTLDDQYRTNDTVAATNMSNDTDTNIAPPPISIKKYKKYIVVNGFDRNISHHATRYNWRVALNTPLKNVKNIKFNSLILPIENNDRKNKAIVYHNRDYKLGVQYVSLQVAELSDTYQGTTQDVGQMTTCFIFDSTYTCSNGRGYIIMKPSQDEVKEYHQQLTSLSSLSVSLTKPSGMLVSQTRDMYKVKKIEFEYYNQMYLKVVLDKYFDKGDFNVGDNVKLSNYEIFKTSNTSETNTGDFIEFANFANNKHGHEIVEMGDANEQGFFNTFYIPAPSVFDEMEGKLRVKDNLIKALREFNTTTDAVKDAIRAASGSGNSESGSEGSSIINMSLQVSIHFEVDIEEGAVFQSQIVK